MTSSLQNVKVAELEKVQSVKELTERAAHLWGDKVGLIFDEFNERITYNEINERSNRIAKVLQNVGVEAKDRVAIMLRNRPEFPLTWLGIGKLGAIMVPINIYYKEFDAKYLLEHSEANVIVTSSEFIPLLKTIQTTVPTLKTIITVDDESHENVLSLKDAISTIDNEQPLTNSVYPESIMNIQYTSGTTGRPKGCMLTHNYWLAFARKNVLLPYPQINQDDVLLTAQPFYYMDPQWNVITSLASGGTLIVLDRFHPSSFWEKVREYKVTFFYCLGIMPVLMLKMPKSPHDRENSVRHIACSAIPVHLHKELEERWGAPWFEAFGMTETGSDIGVTREEHDGLVGTGCIGRPNPFREARIVDENDQTLPRREIGELVLRGPAMMDGYFKNPEATKEVFRNGYFHTGDLAYMTEEGLIYYIGRKKEMIRRSGENISATEVEDVIKLYPNVKYVAVLPVSDELRGEEVKAYVVLQEGEPADTEQVKKLLDFSKERLAYFKIPRYWEFRDDLPRTPSERVAKHVLRDEKSDLRLGSYDSVENVWRTIDK
jgi:carnitine-CoA ligase